eukprot:s4654_g9.t1
MAFRTTSVARRLQRVVLASCSEKLRKLVEQAKEPDSPAKDPGSGGANGAKSGLRTVAAGASAAAVTAVLDFIYSGQAQLPPQTVPEVARIARRWDLLSLQETLAASLSSENGGLTPAVVAALFALGEPFGEALGAAARAFVLGNFAACAATEPFQRWPAKVLEYLLKSDQLTVASEEETLLWAPDPGTRTPGISKSSDGQCPSGDQQNPAARSLQLPSFLPSAGRFSRCRRWRHSAT